MNLIKILSYKLERTYWDVLWARLDNEEHNVRGETYSIIFKLSISYEYNAGMMMGERHIHHQYKACTWKSQMESDIAEDRRESGKNGVWGPNDREYHLGEQLTCKTVKTHLKESQRQL